MTAEIKTIRLITATYDDVATIQVPVVSYPEVIVWRARVFTKQRDESDTYAEAVTYWAYQEDEPAENEIEFVRAMDNIHPA